MNDKILQLNNNFLTTSGWIKSWELNQCVDQNGNFLPWYNYPVINFLKQRLNSNISVFEFGCGYSTLFYAKYCKKVISIEKTPEWMGKILDIANLNNIFNIKIILNQHNFASNINLLGEKFDLIIIDSIERLKCAVSGCANLNDSGIIILDNSERKSYKKIFGLFAEKSFKEITFSGIGPLRYNLSHTTVFYKTNNIFNL